MLRIYRFLIRCTLHLQTADGLLQSIDLAGKQRDFPTEKQQDKQQKKYG
jgi:hypothetical protein